MVPKRVRGLPCAAMTRTSALAILIDVAFVDADPRLVTRDARCVENDGGVGIASDDVLSLRQQHATSWPLQAEHGSMRSVRRHQFCSKPVPEPVDGSNESRM